MLARVYGSSHVIDAFVPCLEVHPKVFRLSGLVSAGPALVRGAGRFITWGGKKGQYSGSGSETPSFCLLRHPGSRCIHRCVGGTCHFATNLEAIAPGQLWAPCSARSSTNPTSARWRRCYGALWTQQNPPERHQPGPAETSAWACVQGALEQSEQRSP